MGMRNTLGQLGGVLFVAGKLSDGAALDFSSNLANAGDISITDTGNGDYNLVIKNFKGPRGYAVPILTTATISTFASATSVSYSGDTLTVTIKIENDASTATNASVYFMVMAF